MKANHLLFPLLLWGIAAQAKPTTANLNFIENKGQVTDQYGKSRNDIDFRSGNSGLNIYIGSGQLHYQWAKQLAPVNDQSIQTAMYRMDVNLVGANAHAQVTTENKQGYYEHYYISALGEQGATAYAYQKITYKDVYPNIDWILYVKDNTIEYDFVVRPGGKVSDIHLQYGGATATSVDKTGQLTATTPMGSVSERAPYSYQADGRQVASRFVLQDNILSFYADTYTGTLVIDPTLSWSTYYGGTGSETIKQGCVTGDKYGGGYLGGITASTSNIVTSGSYQDTITGGADAFLVKFNTGGARQWATYYGGPSAETVYGITCDPVGNVYLSGYTSSISGIASPGAYQTSSAGSTDAFLVKFDSSGARQWGTYFGGSSAEQCFAVTCDTSNNVYIAGYTSSSAGIASSTAYQPSSGGGQDCFLAKFNGNGSLQWSTYYGGSSTEQALGISCDASNHVYLAGYTQSTSGIATTGSYQSTIGGSKDAFLVKFDSTGARQWGTYYGGTGIDEAFAVACDGNGNSYITGNTVSTTSIATTGSFQSTLGDVGSAGGNAFLAKFNTAGNIQWATYYGGNGGDGGYALSYSSLGNVYLAGLTSSTTNISTAGVFQDTLTALNDAMLAKFDTSGNRVWGTYFGGESSDYGYGVYCSPTSQIFLGGQTTSFGLYTTTGAYQTSNGGGSDGYLVMFNDCTLTTPSTVSGSDTVCSGGSYSYSIAPVAGATSYTWTLPAGWIGNGTTDTILITAGAANDTIKVAANFVCGTSDQQVKAVTVSQLPALSPTGTTSICNGDSVTLSTSIGVAYQWLQNNVVIGGATAQSYAVHTGGNYSVVVTSASGCADTTALDTIIVHPTPVPVITPNSNVLSTGSFTSYQWSHDGTPITGAMNRTYTMVIDSGNYTVTVIDSNGCTGTSAVFVPSLAVGNVSGIHSVSLYPNPTTGIVYLSTAEKVNIAVSSTDGRQLASYATSRQIDLSMLPDGLYVLHSTATNGMQLGIEKIVKTTAR